MRRETEGTGHMEYRRRVTLSLVSIQWWVPQIFTCAKGFILDNGSTSYSRILLRVMQSL